MDRKILWDCHMHSSFSADSDTPMESMIQRAVELGLKGITFTEHLDPDYPATPDGLDFSLDIPSYQKKLAELSDTYKDKIQIRFGIELGLQMHLGEYFDSLLAQVPFDFAIGSSHLVHGYDPYYPEFFEGRKEFLCYMEYFESILENISVYDGFDVYGHIDYIIRYVPDGDRVFSYKKHADQVDAILKLLIEKGKGIEINTGGYKAGLSEPNPCHDVLRRYKELGGEIITMGSDAHTTEYVAYRFADAKEVLKECGFRYFTVFRERKAEFVPL